MSLLINHIYNAQAATWEYLDTPSLLIKSVETTPWGIFLGEQYVSSNPDSYGGVFISKDMGTSWSMAGIPERSVTDLKYFNKQVYATTYYSVEGFSGLFVYTGDTTWTHLGPSFPASCVDRDANTIYLGGYGHGLWISQDNGDTWTQTLGNGYYGPKVIDIAIGTNTTWVLTEDGIYNSQNEGINWEFKGNFSPEIITTVYALRDTALVGTNKHVYFSEDLGDTWNILEIEGTGPIDKMFYYQDTLYVAAINPDSGKKTVYKSSDLLEWQNTQLELPAYQRVIDIEGAYSSPSKLFVIATSGGLFSSNITERYLTEPFLDIPWDYTDTGELTSSISAYFDHEYPLLGYTQYQEPQDTKETTLNFTGIKERPPNIYYSSHSGTDYALPFGKAVKAPASGIASYYYCTNCGHSIRIKHTNGYETVYMHLQEDTAIWDKLPRNVEKGEIIGHIGLSGKTTGPHLHFEVNKDLSQNGIFSDDFPEGRTDPYGWFNNTLEDPWSSFTWYDTNGYHKASPSKYLWVHPYHEQSILIGRAIENLLLDNKYITIDQTTSDSNITVFIREGGVVEPPRDNQLQQLIPNTSFILDAIDLVGNSVAKFLSPITIRVGLEEETLKNIVKSSLAIYYWDEITNKWTLLPTFIDLATNILITEVDHMSRFAVFGEKLDSYPPTTEIIISGNRDGIWYIEKPRISLLLDNDEIDTNDYTVYSLDAGITWKQYRDPVTLSDTEGIITFLYKSSDINNNIEEANNIVIHIDTHDKRNKSLEIMQTKFQISQ